MTTPSQKILLVDDKEANLIAMRAIMEAPRRRHLPAAATGARGLPSPPIAAASSTSRCPRWTASSSRRCSLEQLHPGSSDPVRLRRVPEDAHVFRGYEAGAVDFDQAREGAHPLNKLSSFCCSIRNADNRSRSRRRVRASSRA